jgi:hypothetical protein
MVTVCVVRSETQCVLLSEIVRNAYGDVPDGLLGSGEEGDPAGVIAEPLENLWVFFFVRSAY